MNMKPDDTIVPTPAQAHATQTEKPVKLAAPANDDFDDEQLTLPESAPALNRMGMDTISCVGCQ